MNWINVKDKLPIDNRRVIILLLDDITNYSYPYTYEDACEMGFYENGKWFSDTRFEVATVGDTFWKDIQGVTHWSYLPDKPEK